MSVEWLAYTRKDFIFPVAQKFPHRAPNEETAYLQERFPTGHAFVMGPLTGDHWFVFVADFLDRSTTECADRTLDVRVCAGLRGAADARERGGRLPRSEARHRMLQLLRACAMQ